MLTLQQELRNLADESRRKPIRLSEIIPYLQKAADALDGQQYKIDELMQEFCPDEMTPEQWENWAKHQVPYTATEAEIQETLAKLCKEN
jgi:hypothetical protein